MILIDRPTWPAHGTYFGHLVSDLSLDELHAFARAAGIPARGFDHDHYDVPESRYDDLVALGAHPVGARELLRRLVASGLRVRPAERTPNRRAARALVTAAWDDVLPGRHAVRDELMARWSEPHRRYHDVRHLASMLMALDELGSGDRCVRLAAWFHDAVHAGTPGRDEEESAELAVSLLSGELPVADVDEVARLVLLTVSHDVGRADSSGAALVDADLSILGQAPGRYHVYARDVRVEYEHVDDARFVVRRVAVLERLLSRDPLYRTPIGARLWGDQARTNMTAEIARLSGAGGAGAG